MGDLTRSELLTAGGLAGGNDQPSDYVRIWLDNWLRRTAKTWPWPECKKRVDQVSVASGASSVNMGNAYSTLVTGEGTLTTHWIHRLLGGLVFWYVPGTYNPNGRALVRPLLGGDPAADESASLASGRPGLPDTVKVRQRKGSLTLYLNPVPDRALYLAFDVQWVPPRIGSDSTTDATIPWYPNDRTLAQAVKCATLEMDALGQPSLALEQAMGALGSMVVDDRDFDGEQAGDNQVMELDPNVFGGAQDVPGSKWWPR